MQKLPLSNASKFKLRQTQIVFAKTESARHASEIKKKIVFTTIFNSSIIIIISNLYKSFLTLKLARITASNLCWSN